MQILEESHQETEFETYDLQELHKKGQPEAARIIADPYIKKTSRNINRVNKLINEPRIINRIGNTNILPLNSGF